MIVDARTGAVTVGDRVVNVNECDHEANPPVCRCIHDWRIEWGNVERTEL